MIHINPFFEQASPVMSSSLAAASVTGLASLAHAPRRALSTSRGTAWTAAFLACGAGAVGAGAGSTAGAASRFVAVARHFQSLFELLSPSVTCVLSLG